MTRSTTTSMATATPRTPPTECTPLLPFRPFSNVTMPRVWAEEITTK